MQTCSELQDMIGISLVIEISALNRISCADRYSWRWHCQKLTLMDITNKICDELQARVAQGKYHGVLLIPKGLIESIPEMYALIQLSPWAVALCRFFPPFIRTELLLH